MRPRNRLSCSFSYIETNIKTRPRTLVNLLSGMAKRDAQTLAQAEVRLDAVAPAIPRLLELCAKTR